MTLVNVETGEILADISAEEARSITDKIKVAVEGAWHLIEHAYLSRAWAALGYASWDDYCTREFGTSRLRLPREERQEVVASLRDSGLSIRAIAAAVGTGTRQVQEAIAAQVCSETTPDEPKPDPRDAYDRMREAMVAKNRPAPEPKPITGTDGKTYTAPPPPASKPKRSPLSDAAQKAGWDFRKATERLERIVADDRFTANKEQVAAHLHGHLSYALEVCQDLLDQLDHQSQEDR